MSTDVKKIEVAREDLEELILIYEVEAINYSDKKALEWIRQLRDKYGIYE